MMKRSGFSRRSISLLLVTLLFLPVVLRKAYSLPQWKYDVTLTGYPNARWKSPTSYIDKPAFGDVTGDGFPKIVATSLFGDVFCVDGMTGRILWAYEDEHSFDLAIYICPALVDVDCDRILDIISVTPQGNVICLEGRNGRKLWSFKASAPIAFSPTAFDLDRNGTPEIAVSDLSGNLYLLDNRGVLLWKTATQAAIYGTPAMGLLDQLPVVITADHGGSLRCFDGRNGNLVWKFSPSDTPLTTSPILFHDAKDSQIPNKVLVGSQAGDFHIVNAASGIPVLSRQVAPKEALGDFSLGDVNGDGFLEAVFSTSGSRVMAVAITNAKVVWTVKFKIPVKEFLDPTGRKKLSRDVLTGEPVLADLNGDGRLDVVIEFRGLNNYIYGLNGADGKQLWSYGTKDLFLNPALNESSVLATYQESGPLSSFSTTVPAYSQPTPIVADFDGDGKAELIVNDRDEVGLINVPLSVGVSPGIWAKYVADACNNTINFSVPCLGVASMPTIGLSIEPQEITAGESARLCWKSTPGTSLQIDPGVGPVDPVDCATVMPTVPTTWVAIAHNCGGDAKASIALAVKPKPVEPPPASPPISPPATPVLPTGSKPAVWMLEDVFFEYDWYRLTPEAVAILDANIQKLKAHPEARVALEGTCDERGAIIYNRYLAIARAESAREYLISKGIEESRLEIRALGESTKWDSRLNDQGWALNRRVHFVLLP